MRHATCSLHRVFLPNKGLEVGSLSTAPASLNLDLCVTIARCGLTRLDACMLAAWQGVCGVQKASASNPTNQAGGLTLNLDLYITIARCGLARLDAMLHAGRMARGLWGSKG